MDFSGEAELESGLAQERVLEINNAESVLWEINGGRPNLDIEGTGSQNGSSSPAQAFHQGNTANDYQVFTDEKVVRIKPCS